MATIDFVVKNGLVVTEEAQILGITDATSSTDSAAAVYTAGGVAVTKKVFVGTDLAVGGATTLTGDIAVNGGDITTNQPTFNLANTNATTVNFAGAATVLEIGAATGTTNINNNLDVDGDVNIDGGDLTVSTATFNLANTTATTVNFAGAATALEIGAATGTTSINNDLDVDGDVNIDGGDLTVSTATFNLANANATTVNFAGAATVLEIGAATGTTSINNNLDVDGDVNIDGGDLTVSTATFNLANTTATTGNLFGAASAVNIGAAGSAGTLTIKNDNVQVDGDLQVRGGDLTTNQTTFNLVNATATTGNLFGAGTTISIGAATGTTTINNADTVITGDLTVNGGDVVTAATTFNLVNTTATTLNAFGAAATLTIGATTGTVTVRNPTVTLSGATTVNVDGANPTFASTSTGTLTLFNTNLTTATAFGTATTVNIGNTTAAQTINIGNASIGASTYNLATAPTATATTKTVNIGTGGASGSTTNVNIGSAIAGTTTISSATLVGAVVTQNLFNTVATTVNAFGAAGTIDIGAASGTVTVKNPTLTMTNGTVFNMNGTNPAIASSNTGTASIFNANITAINFGQAAAISMGGTSSNVTVRGNLLVDGNTTIGNAAGDIITFTNDVANVNATNNLSFSVDNAINTDISYPVKFRHTTSGAAAAGIGTGVQFVTENAAGSNIIGGAIESVSTNVTAASEAFDLVIRTMTAGAVATQALRINTTTHTVGASGTAQTITTQTNSNLTVTTGASGATSAGNTLLVAGGAGGVTSGAGGAATFRGGEATTTSTGGIATFRSGNAAGANFTGADTVILAGNGTGTGGSGSIVFRTAAAGSSGSAANTMVDRFTITNTGQIIFASTGATAFSGDVTVGGNLTVNGTLTTVNSSTVTIDDKNIELASVAVITGLTVTITSGSGVIGFIGASRTTGLLAGQTLTITSTQSGAPAMGAGAVIQSVDSLTQVTMSVVATGTTGNVTVSSSGATDATADGGGVTVIGTTNKTWNYVLANTAWTSNQNVDIVNTKTYKIAATDVLSSSAVLQNAATASIGRTSASATVNVGGAITGNILSINSTAAGTANLTTAVTTGILNEFVGVTGTVNYGSAATTINMFNTAAAAQTFQLGGASTAASTYSIAHGATANATIKTVNLGTAGTNGSTTNVNIGSAVSGALGTTTVNARIINLGTTSNAAITTTVGPAITGNILKIASTAAGTANLTTDVTTGAVDLFTSVTSGAVNIATGAGGSINLGGAATAVNIGTISGNSTLTVNGNGTAGTATLTTNVTTGIVNLVSGITTGTVNIATGGASTTNIGGNAATLNLGAAAGNAVLNIRGNGTGGTAAINTNVTTGSVNVMAALTTGTMTIGSAAAGRVSILFNQASTSTTTGALVVNGGLGVNGAVNALTKSFIIPHPTKPGMLLKHGSLEGPEFGVYVRGRCTGEYIELPEYWSGLVDLDTITVDLTPMGKHQKLYVERIEGLRVYVGNDAVFGKSVHCFYTIWGERRDVGKLDIEANE